MSIITGTLIQGLTQKDIQAIVNKINVNGFQFGTHFPVKKVNSFTWKALTNQNDAANVAADIMADNASFQRKSRPIFQSATGELPHIGISREMKRSELKEYQVALALAGDAQAKELVEFWANDVEFCFTGVQAELEYVAWKLASNAGVFSVSNANNSGAISEFDLDYQVDDWQKLTVSTSFDTPASADVLGLFRNARTVGKAHSLNVKYAFMSLDEFDRIASCEQIIKACASYLSNLAGISQTPTLSEVNAMLARQAFLGGLQIVVIDQTVSRELQGGSHTTGNPFIDHRIVFSEGRTLGSTQYDILRENSSVILRAERAHTVVKKYGMEEPYKEVTIGETDALPVFDTAYRCLYAKTDATAW